MAGNRTGYNRFSRGALTDLVKERVPEDAGQSGDRMTKTILLADDSLTIQKVVELTFADTPFTVVAVSSGDELLDKIPEVQPAVIISDIMMPGRDGYDVCQDIKSSPDTLHIPVILLSGTFEPLDRDRALAVGCSEILTKPFEARKLIDTVERLVRGQEATPALAAAELRVGPADTGPIAFGTGDTGGFSPSPADLRAAAPVGRPQSAPTGLEDGLDFTESGFADMEAAALERAAVTVEAPPDGLDFEIGAADVDPFSDLGEAPAEAPGDQSFADAFEAGGEPFADGASELDESDVAGAVFSSPERRVPPAPPELRADTGPILATAEAPAGQPALELARSGANVGAGSPFISDADTAPLPPLEEAAPAARETTAAPPEAAGGLSDADVDRIARRVLELAHGMIEQVAWEVIPDVAEVVVRERIRQLEADFEPKN